MSNFRKIALVGFFGLLSLVPVSAQQEMSLKSDIPEDFERNLDNLQNSWYIKSTAHHRECRNAGENPSFSAKTYAERLSKLPTVIDMPYNERVRELIDFYANKRRGQVERMLGLTRYYFPIFEQALEAAGMPLELKYLPVIESALNPAATSRVGAAGLWQFMVATGRIYDLDVNSLIDERRDPLKASKAGVRYLKALYNIYGDWHLAIAAYNCGPGNINKAISRSGGKRTFWEIYDYLPRETRGYVPAFIAANYIMTYYKEHNLCPVEVSLPKYSDTIVVKEKVYLSKVAEVLRLDQDELRAMNPQFRTDLIPGHTNEFTLYFPQNYANLFIANLDSIRSEQNRFDNLPDSVKETTLTTARENLTSEQSSKPKGKKVTYKVRSGETLSSIADKYDVAVGDIREWNNLRSTRVKRGQNLTIYTTQKKAASSAVSNSESKPKPKPKAEFIYYKVKRGDNLSDIATKYGVTLAEIKQVNSLKTTKVLVGQQLKIPNK